MSYLLYTSTFGLALVYSLNFTPINNPVNDQDGADKNSSCKAYTYSYNRDTTIQLSSFDTLSVQGNYDVILKKGDEEKLEILTKESEIGKLIIKLKGGILSIFKYKDDERTTLKDWISELRNNQSDEDRMKIVIYYTHLSKIVLMGSSDLKIENTLSADHFTLIASGATAIKGDFSIKNKFNITISGSAGAYLSGSCKYLSIKASGSSGLDAKKLSAENAEVKVSGSADAKVSASKSIKARVSGSGDILYKGNPKQEEIQTSGSGNIRKI